jgi:hypothetical protein
LDEIEGEAPSRSPRPPRPRIGLAAVGIWIAVGILAVASVLLKDIGALLGDIQSLGRHSYDAGVFTGFKLRFWDTSELADAINLWQAPQTIELVKRLLAWHLWVDALAFAPAFATVAAILLWRVGATRAFALGMSLILFGVDEVETLTTWTILVRGNLQDPGGVALAVMQLFSLGKWAAISVAFVTLLALWRKPEASSYHDVVRAVKRSRAGAEQSPVLALMGLVILVAAFGALVALPAGGPLDQIPDVIRYQLSGASPLPLALSILSLGLLAAAVGAAGMVATDLLSGEAGEEVATLQVGAGAAVLSGALFAWAWSENDRWSLVPLAPLFVVGGLAVAGWLAGKAHVSPRPLPRGKAVPEPASWYRWSTLWVGGLVGAVVIVGGLGLVRASFRPFLLQVPDGWMPWSMWALVGAAIGVFGGFTAQWTVLFTKRFVRRGFSRLSQTSLRRLRPVGLVGVPIGAGAVWLASNPEDARYVGTTGVVALSLGLFALVIGSLSWISRTQRRWGVTHTLGLGARTPWLGLVIVTWVVASLLNTEGGYHDARVGTEFGPSGPRYTSLKSALDTWVDAQPEECTPSTGEPMPLVLVAAPGGGIRAAYWTAAGLEELFGRDPGNCAAPRLFAISSVSGSSVGAVTWASASSQERSARQAVTAMSEDRALAAAAAGLLLRDMFQPFTGVIRGWRDRAAVLEDGWTESADVLGTEQKPAKWSDVGEGGGLPWVPLLVLNGSSVTDGCRVTISNVAGLTAAPGSDCYAAPALHQPPSGPLTGAIDPFPGLYERQDRDATECDGTDTGMRAITAALLSARFPLVSPSGALLRCYGERAFGEEEETRTYTVTYDVDGGYYENSGLLAVLQIWAALEPHIRIHNQTLRPGESAIEPWIVVLDNHYRSSARAREPRRPLELVAPITTLGAGRLLEEGALEQMAAIAMRVRVEGCTVNGAASVAQGQGPRFECPIHARNPTGFVRLAPQRAPSLAAPLGWVLSAASRANLEAELKKQLSAQDPSLQRLISLLAGPE